VRDDNIKRNYYWCVEATKRDGSILFSKEYLDFETAWKKYYSFKGVASVSLQRKYREVKMA